jgi:glycine betaine/proline transport system substrate-binding protein
VVGSPNWPSGQASAQIIKYAVEKQFGLDVEVRELGEMTIFAGLDSGEVDINPEVWLPNLDALVKKYRDDRKSVELSPKGVPATQGICTTRDAADKIGLHDITDLRDPAKTANFDTDGDGKGEIWIGDQTWSSTTIERIRAKSYGYADTMRLVETPEDVAMAAVDAAVATGKPIVFFCYSPHHIFKLHEIVQLTEPAHDDAKWKIVWPSDDADWLAKSDAPVAWANSHFHIAFSRSMAERLPNVVAFLSNIDFTPDEVTEMTYALQVEGRPPAEYAQEWIARHQDRLSNWSK